MTSPMSQYDTLIGTFLAVAATMGCAEELGDALSQLVVLYIQQGAPYGLELVGLARWMQEQLARAATGADLVVVSA